jgi:hypothetical protein
MRSSRAALAAAVVGAGIAAYAALLASSASAQRPEGGAIELSGRKVRCDNVEIVMDRRLPSEGAAAPGVLILNPRMLNEQPATVRLFVFHHECGHHHVGDNELKADCWAVQRGVRDGWLDQRGLKEVCDSFEDAPETSSHPSGRRRCRNIDQCFATAFAALPPRTPIGPKTAGLPADWHRPRLRSWSRSRRSLPRVGCAMPTAGPAPRRIARGPTTRSASFSKKSQARPTAAIDRRGSPSGKLNRPFLCRFCNKTPRPGPARLPRAPCDSPTARVTFLHYQQD